ncbi:hypothetical protein SNEBB_010132 [Seison nebaliae]|nr:hypothetical protein SNEBB_010132 [Seison nebaliae]
MTTKRIYNSTGFNAILFNAKYGKLASLLTTPRIDANHRNLDNAPTTVMLPPITMNENFFPQNIKRRNILNLTNFINIDSNEVILRFVTNQIKSEQTDVSSDVIEQYFGIKSVSNQENYTSPFIHLLKAPNADYLCSQRIRERNLICLPEKFCQFIISITGHYIIMEVDHSIKDLAKSTKIRYLNVKYFLTININDINNQQPMWHVDPKSMKNFFETFENPSTFPVFTMRKTHANNRFSNSHYIADVFLNETTSIGFRVPFTGLKALDGDMSCENGGSPANYRYYLQTNYSQLSENEQQHYLIKYSQLDQLFDVQLTKTQKSLLQLELVLKRRLPQVTSFIGGKRNYLILRYLLKVKDKHDYFNRRFNKNHQFHFTADSIEVNIHVLPHSLPPIFDRPTYLMRIREDAIIGTRVGRVRAMYPKQRLFLIKSVKQYFDSWKTSNDNYINKKNNLKKRNSPKSRSSLLMHKTTSPTLTYALVDLQQSINGNQLNFYRNHLGNKRQMNKNNLDFSIDALTGEIIVTKKLDREIRSTYHLQAIATYWSNDLNKEHRMTQAKVDVTIRIDDVNDNIPTIDIVLTNEHNHQVNNEMKTQKYNTNFSISSFPSSTLNHSTTTKNRLLNEKDSTKLKRKFFVEETEKIDSHYLFGTTTLSSEPSGKHENNIPILYLFENSIVGEYLFYFQVNDADHNDMERIQVNVQTKPYPNYIRHTTLDNQTYTVFLNHSLQYDSIYNDELREFFVVINATDIGGKSTEKYVKIIVLDSNDNSPEIHLDSLQLIDTKYQSISNFKLNKTEVKKEGKLNEDQKELKDKWKKSHIVTDNSTNLRFSFRLALIDFDTSERLQEEQKLKLQIVDDPFNCTILIDNDNIFNDEHSTDIYDGIIDGAYLYNDNGYIEKKYIVKTDDNKKCKSLSVNLDEPYLIKFIGNDGKHWSTVFSIAISVLGVNHEIFEKKKLKESSYNQISSDKTTNTMYVGDLIRNHFPPSIPIQLTTTILAKKKFMSIFLPILGAFIFFAIIAAALALLGCKKDNRNERPNGSREKSPSTTSTVSTGTNSSGKNSPTSKDEVLKNRNKSKNKKQFRFRSNGVSPITSPSLIDSLPSSIIYSLDQMPNKLNDSNEQMKYLSVNKSHKSSNTSSEGKLLRKSNFIQDHRNHLDEIECLHSQEITTVNQSSKFHNDPMDSVRSSVFYQPSYNEIAVFKRPGSAQISSQYQKRNGKYLNDNANANGKEINQYFKRKLFSDDPCSRTLINNNNNRASLEETQSSSIQAGNRYRNFPTSHQRTISRSLYGNDSLRKVMNERKAAEIQRQIQSTINKGNPISVPGAIDCLSPTRQKNQEKPKKNQVVPSTPLILPPSTTNEKKRRFVNLMEEIREKGEYRAPNNLAEVSFTNFEQIYHCSQTSPNGAVRESVASSSNTNSSSDVSSFMSASLLKSASIKKQRSDKMLIRNKNNNNDDSFNNRLFINKNNKNSSSETTRMTASPSSTESNGNDLSSVYKTMKMML